MIYPDDFEFCTPEADMMVTLQITGRSPVSVWKKLNPIWWFGNDSEQQLPDWYMPSWPLWRRNLYWYYFRNPLRNFQAFVIGVQDRNYTLTGRAPPLTVQRDDLRPVEYGFQWAVLYGGDLWVPRPFLSYSGTRFVWQFGWQPTGIFALKFNIKDGIPL